MVFAVSWVLVPRHGTIYEYHGGATYLDGCALFENEERECNPYLEDCSGDRRQMREGDGIHLSNAGGDRQARAVMRVLLKSYRLES